VLTNAFPDDYFAPESSEESSPAAKPVRQPKQLSPEKLEQRAKNVMLHQLSRQAKSEHQLREVLIKREIPAEIIDKVITRFTEAGLIDDRQVAQTIAHTRRATRGLSSSAIKRELAQKGISAEIIESTLAVFAAEDELATAISIATRRIRSLAKFEPDVRKRRLLGFLARKGYPGSVAFAAIKAAETEIIA
jgi:regulatory protein